MTKAFDNVRHVLLADKLKALSLNLFMTHWYLKFLKDRNQRLIFNGYSCNWKTVNKGTTPGSVSSPYLFNIFVNDLEVNLGPSVKLIKYADDATLAVAVDKTGN